MKRHRWTLPFPHGLRNAVGGDQCEHCGLVREYSHYSGSKGTLRYYRESTMVAASGGAWGIPRNVARGCPPCEAPEGWQPPPQHPTHLCANGCGYPVPYEGAFCGECMCEDDGDIW